MKKDAIILVHGGPVAEPADADFIMKNTRHCHGFYGASSMERLPVEIAIAGQTRAFKQIARRQEAPGKQTTSKSTTRKQATRKQATKRPARKAGKST